VFYWNFVCCLLTLSVINGIFSIGSSSVNRTSAVHLSSVSFDLIDMTYQYLFRVFRKSSTCQEGRSYILGALKFSAYVSIFYYIVFVVAVVLS
jgi:hypothetical protein